MNYGLYIHIPFCIKKCAYCDFASGAFDNEIQKSYIDALIKEIKSTKRYNIDTIFFGGGTPSSIDASYISSILECINENMNLCPDAEITIEANPGTLSIDKLYAYKNMGINRISLGVQSFNDEELGVLGRIHNSQDATDAVGMIKEAGFTNFNIDIMLSIPHQDMDSLSNTLQKAIDLSPTHISAYSLIIEEGTPFYEHSINNTLRFPEEDMQRDMCDYAYSFIEKNGYNRYEISNFAKSGYESRHNLKYWKCLPYIGVGSAAHSYDGEKRFYNTCDVREYINLIHSGSSACVGEYILSESDKICEYIIMSLRLKNGIILNDFYKRFNFRFEKKYESLIKKYSDSGFLSRDNEKICFTDEGFAISNSILSEFV